MSAAASPASKTKRSAAKRPLMYRGLRLPTLPQQTHFTREQLEQAVEAAFVKHADAIVRGRKA